MITIGYTFNKEHFDYYIDTDDLRRAITRKVIYDFNIDVKIDKQKELLSFLLYELVESSIEVQNIFAHKYESYLIEYFRDDAKRYYTIINTSL